MKGRESDSEQPLTNMRGQSELGDGDYGVPLFSCLKLGIIKISNICSLDWYKITFYYFFDIHFFNYL